MKVTYLLLLFTVVLLSFFSCRTLSYFESPNNLRNIEGTLHFVNGKSLSGKLVIETENVLGNPVKLYMNEDRKPMQFNMNEINGYSIRNEHYEKKEIREALNIGRGLFL